MSIASSKPVDIKDNIKDYLLTNYLLIPEIEIEVNNKFSISYFITYDNTNYKEYELIIESGGYNIKLECLYGVINDSAKEKTLEFPSSLAYSNIFENLTTEKIQKEVDAIFNRINKHSSKVMV